MELYFFLGPSVTDVLQQYHTVTGLPRMPPLAALGKHQSRWNYITPQDVMEAPSCTWSDIKISYTSVVERKHVYSE